MLRWPLLNIQPAKQSTFQFDKDLLLNKRYLYAIKIVARQFLEICNCQIMGMSIRFFCSISLCQNLSAFFLQNSVNLVIVSCQRCHHEKNSFFYYIFLYNKVMQQNVYESDCLTTASLDHSHLHCQLLTISAYVCHIKILCQWWLLNVLLLI